MKKKSFKKKNPAVQVLIECKLKVAMPLKVLNRFCLGGGGGGG